MLYFVFTTAPEWPVNVDAIFKDLQAAKDYVYPGYRTVRKMQGWDFGPLPSYNDTQPLAEDEK
jgi:hypothetical protein